MKSVTPDNVVFKLSKIVGTGRTVKPKKELKSFKTVPDIILRPKMLKNVKKIISTASDERIPIVNMADGFKVYIGKDQEVGGIGLDLTNMNGVTDIDKTDLSVTVEPGASWKKIDSALSKPKLRLNVYPSFKPETPIGDWVNIGGTGIGSYKYGGIEQQVRSMEIVLADGKVITSGFKKVLNNSSGYNLRDLFLGSEGTLGIVTKVTLKVSPVPKEIRPASFAYPKFTKAAGAIQALVRTSTTPYHISFFEPLDSSLGPKAGKEADPTSTLLNLAFDGENEIIDHEEKAVDGALGDTGGKKLSRQAAFEEWNNRFPVSRLKVNGPLFLMGSLLVPLSQLAKIEQLSKQVLKGMKAKGAVAGIVCDRNTAMFNTFAFKPEESILKDRSSVLLLRKFNHTAFKLGARPDGFGVHFKEEKARIHGKGISLLSTIKSNLDPHDVLNPL